jgi:hypothetical protein
VNGAVAGDHAIAGYDLFVHAKVVATMGDEHADFLEGTFVEQEVDALPCGEFAFFVLTGNAFFTAAEFRFLNFLLE